MWNSKLGEFLLHRMIRCEWILTQKKFIHKYKHTVEYDCDYVNNQLILLIVLFCFNYLLNVEFVAGNLKSLDCEHNDGT